MFDYFHASENEQYLFLQMPLLLIKDEQFKGLSDGAKILYSLLLNRTSLSSKNGWTDEQERVYIIYTIEEITKDLNCWEQKAVKSMKELKEIGLVKSVRQGLGKPNLIYVMNFATALKYQSKENKKTTNSAKSMNCENHNSRIATNTNQEPVKITIQELPESQSINNDFKKINNNSISSQCQTCEAEKEKKEKTDMTRIIDTVNHLSNIFEIKKGLPQTNADQANGLQSPSANTKYSTDDYNTYKKLIQDNIQYNHYLHNRQSDVDLINELVNCMLDVILTKGDTVKVNGEEKNRTMVKSQYLKINSEDIDHILDRYKSQHHKITHLHSYLKTMLYTVKQESNHYYTNAVRADGVVL